MKQQPQDSKPAKHKVTFIVKLPEETIQANSIEELFAKVKNNYKMRMEDTVEVIADITYITPTDVQNAKVMEF